MVVDTKIGDAVIRRESVDSAVKQVVEKALKFMQGLTVSSTNAWKNTFYREKSGVLSAKSSLAGFEGIPRGANFPRATVQWDKISSRIIKYGAEDFIFWEDILTDDIDVKRRVILKLSEAVANQIDSRIWADLGGNNTVEAQTVGSIQSFSVKARPWTSSSAAILDDLFRARQLLGEQNYPTSDLQVWIRPRLVRAIAKFITDKGAQFPTISIKTAENGTIENIAGFRIVESNNAAASSALVVVPKRCATFKELVPMQTALVTEDTTTKFKGELVRVVGEGVVELTDPLAVVNIMGTEGTEL